MDRKSSRFQGILAAAGMLILILDSRHALEGARSGMELCIKTVIPSLFPFFVLSATLTNSLGEKRTGAFPLVAKVLGIPESAGSILIPSILGGYPVGAKCVGDFYRRKQISRKEAERLLAFSSNAGPSFLFGMVSAFFPERKMTWLLWFIHIFSAVLTAAAIPAEKEALPAAPSERKGRSESPIRSAAKAMGLVCCWVILFRIVNTFLDAWFLWILPEWMQTLLMGLLELTNGCCELANIPDIRLRFILCSCILAFGGICVLLQTISVTHGLSIRSYLKGKLIQTAFSFLLSCAFALDQGLLFAGAVPVLLYILRKMQNSYSNPRILPV